MIEENTANIYVYFLKKEKAPTRMKVKQGWRAELVSSNVEIMSSIHSTKREAVEEIVHALLDVGFMDVIEVYTLPKPATAKSARLPIWWPPRP